MVSGSIVALVTPMNKAGEIDWPVLNNLVDFHLQEGTHGIVAVGTSGESPTLPVNEHLEVVSRIIERVGGKIPVIAGTGANSTSEAIELTDEARKLGADGALLVTPYYNKPTQEGLYRHFMAIADAVEIPQILYNVPGRTCCDLLPDTLDRLASHANIIGIKEATGDLDRGREVIERCADRIAVFSGDDATALELILMGGKGDISVTANVAPRLMAQMCEAALAGNEAEARAINQRLDALHNALFLEANPIPVKWAMAEMGLIDVGIRLPLTWLSEQYHERLRQAMIQAGVA